MSTDRFVAIEHEMLAFWERERIFDRLVEKNRGKPRWSFLDGPITANNPMGVHHAWGRTYKDIYNRFFAMTGHELRYQNGFDCQGLWVEVEVEKELGFTSKRDIERYGMAAFVEKCKDRVRKYAAIQTQQSIRLGSWMDWDNSYFTMSDENNYTIWQFLKKCHERGWLYHGWDSMPWCPRCGTGISQHEISNEERPIVAHDSPTVKFPLVGRDREFLLVWTTTPWTLTSNVAAAVHPDMTYVQLQLGEESYYVVKERVTAVFGQRGAPVVIRELLGREMEGWAYSGPFDELPAQRGVTHRVISWTEVSHADGTGIVHIAPGCGKEDFELGRALELPMISPIDESGVFVDGFEALTGRFAGDVSADIHQALRARSLLFRTEAYEHAYPICWRCKTQLLFRVVDEWYIGMDRGEPTLRTQIIEVTKQTAWIPEVGQQLEIEWLTNMHDWMISKKRYWGLALPIYPCSTCGTFEVIGGRDELHERAVAGWERFEGHSPHRPWVDDVTIACRRCGAPCSRIADVGNPWLDAGIVPFSTLQYGTDRDYWTRWFPADLISESFPGQFRNWFYAILAMSTVMENRAPFRVMFGYRLMKDEQGEEMHKSKGNSIPFDVAAEQEGADAMRWLFASHNPEQELWFGYGKIREARRQFLTLWNVYEFFLTYSRIAEFDPGAAKVAPADLSLLDRWILSCLAGLVDSAHRNFTAYSSHLFMRDMNVFIDALSRWYIRRSRRRFSKGGDDTDSRAALQTLRECLVTTVKLLAPVIPFTTDAMYQELVRHRDAKAPLSVHLCDFPGADAKIDDALLHAMAVVAGIVEQGHAARSVAKLKVRQPLREMRVEVPEEAIREQLRPFLSLIEDELNVKAVRLVDSVADLYTVSFDLDTRKGKPKYGREFAAVRAALRTLPASDVDSRVRAGEAVRVEQCEQWWDIAPDEIVRNRTPVSPWALAEGAPTVAVDTTVTPELEREGVIRDLVRHVQRLRKEAGFAITDRIRIEYAASDTLAAGISTMADYLAAETLAIAIERRAAPIDVAAEVDIGGERISLRLTTV